MTEPALSKAPPGGLPHDIREIVPVTMPWWYVALGLLAVLALIAFAWWGLPRLYGWLERRRERAEPPDPWDALLARLRLLTPGEPFVGQSAVDFFFEVSSCVKLAIEKRTGLPATDRTTQELRGMLDRLPLSPDAIKEMRAFFDRADMVKFAAAPATIAEALETRDKALSWIGGLRPLSIHLEAGTAQAARNPDENPFAGMGQEVGRGSR